MKQCIIAVKMINIKIVLVLSLAAYVACGGGKTPPIAGTSWDDDDNEYSEPTEPCEPIELSEPIKPSEPIESSELCEFCEPNESIQWSEPSELSELSESSESIGPIQIIGIQNLGVQNIGNPNKGIQNIGVQNFHFFSTKEGINTTLNGEPSESTKPSQNIGVQNIGVQNFHFVGTKEGINTTLNGVRVQFKGGALFINGIEVTEVEANHVKEIHWAKGSLDIDGQPIERFNGIQRSGTIFFIKQ